MKRMKRKTRIALARKLSGLLAALTLFTALTPAASAIGLTGGAVLNLTDSTAASCPVVRPEEGDYYITPEASGSYALDLTGGGSAAKTYFQLWELNRSDAQIVHLEHVTGDWYRLVHKASGKVVNVESGVSKDGARLWLYPYDGTDSCLFRFLDCGNGSYLIQNKLPGNRVLDLDNNLVFNGSRVHLWSTHSGQSARWRLIPVSSTYATVTPPSGDVCITPEANSGYALDLTGGGATKTYFQLWELNRSAAQVFRFVHVRDGWYKIVHAASGKVVNVESGDSHNGARLWLYPYDGTDSCLFRLLDKGNGVVMIQNKLTGTRVFDLDNNLVYNGSRIHLWDCHSGQSAGWRLVSASASSGASTPSASSAEGQILSRLNAMANGSYGSGAYKTGTRYTGAYYTEQCKGFAKKVHMVLFGYNIGSTRSKPNNYQISINASNTSLVGSLTSLSSKSNSAVQSLFHSARAGDFIQVRRSHGGSHSMIYLSSDANGVTVYECNVDGRNGIRTATYSWSSFRSANAAVSVYTAKDYRLH